MRQIEEELRREKKQLEVIIKELKKRLENVPDGHLHIKKRRGSVEYYYRGSGKYIKRGELKLIKQIAKKDYDASAMKCAEERIRAIDLFLKKWGKTSLKTLYRELNPCRQALITPVVLSDEEYIRQWLAEEYNGKVIDKESVNYLTERGELVRSKSEKIIADKLYSLGIPYRYEYPIVLDGGVRIYPDFTVLKMPQRKEVYLEHFGMMDDANYVDGVMYKLNTYEKNGIVLGDSLFVTCESGRFPLNTKSLDRLLKSIVR